MTARAEPCARGLFYIQDRHTGAFREHTLAPGEPVVFSCAAMAQNFVDLIGGDWRVVETLPIEQERALVPPERNCR
jgi:hypothetical protein